MSKTKKNLVFVVENDKLQEKNFKFNFTKDHKHEFVYFKSSDDCLKQLHRHPMAILIDYELKTINADEDDGILLLNKIKELEHHTEVVFFSTHDHPKLAEYTIKHGAYDYIVVNDSQYLRLQNVLSNLENQLFHKKSVKQYKIYSITAWALLGLFLLLVIVLQFMGYLQAGSEEIIEP
jgi:DNA-binding NtrC family response regulator